MVDGPTKIPYLLSPNHPALPKPPYSVLDLSPTLQLVLNFHCSLFYWSYYKPTLSADMTDEFWNETYSAEPLLTCFNESNMIYFG